MFQYFQVVRQPGIAGLFWSTEMAIFQLPARRLTKERTIEKKKTKILGRIGHETIFVSPIFVSLPATRRTIPAADTPSGRGLLDTWLPLARAPRTPIAITNIAQKSSDVNSSFAHIVGIREKSREYDATDIR